MTLTDVATNKPRVSLCSDGDIPEAFKAVSRGFGHDAPFFDAYFPHHDTSAGQAQAVKRLLQAKKAESSWVIKASIAANNDKSEKIIGLAIWTHMTEVPSDKLEDTEDAEETWPNENDREYMKRLWRDYVVPRGEAVKRSEGAGVYVLELLAVDRTYQRQGAGSALVAWGTAAADQKGLEAVVEATRQGLSCYRRAGFQTEIEEMYLNVGEEFESRKRPILAFLSRKAAK